MINKLEDAARQHDASRPVLATNPSPAAGPSIPMVPSEQLLREGILASVAGAGLLVVSQGLARRLDAAYYLTAVADHRRDRRVARQGVRLRGSGAALCRAGAARAGPSRLRSPRGVLRDAVLARLGREVVPPSARRCGSASSPSSTSSTHHELWWQFELHGEASRFLRASVGAGGRVRVRRWPALMRHAPHEAPAPTEADLVDAARDHRRRRPRRSRTWCYLRDKALLFDDGPDGFRHVRACRGGRGSRWAIRSDPRIGIAGLVRLFLERCDDFGGVPVFYEVTPRTTCTATPTSG